VCIGHFALAYAAKRWEPRLSLAVLFAITASTPLGFISYPYS
jgi:hypothetical protein